MGAQCAVMQIIARGQRIQYAGGIERAPGPARKGPAMQPQIDEQTLIDQYIEENPRFPGAAEAWLRETGVPVWAIVGYYQQAAGGDDARVAEDYELPPDAVRAALAYYRLHRRAIEERLAANSA